MTGLRFLNISRLTTLSSLTLPTTSQVTTFINIDGANSNTITSVNFGGLTGLGGEVYVRNNPQCSSITYPTSSQALTACYVSGNKNTLTTLNFSGLTGLRTVLSIEQAGVNSLTIPASLPNNFTTFKVRLSSLTNFDISPVTGAINSLDFSSNTLLASFAGYNWINTSTTSVNFQSCALNQSSIDAILSALNNYFSSHTPTNNLTLTINGGTNAAPTGGNSNTDAVNLQSIFTAGGKTLTYLHN